MKNLLKIFLISWAIVFGASFFTADRIPFFQRLLYTAGLACVPPLISLGKGGSSRSRTPKITAYRGTRYTIHKPLDPHILYRIESGKVYEGYNVAPLLEIKGEKIFKANSSRLVYRIEKNKIYEGMNAAPFLEIRGNKIYPPLTNKPLYEIKAE